MESRVRVGPTHKITFGPAQRNGHGFSVEQRGTGPAAGDWLPVADFLYVDEAEAKEAAKLVKQALTNVLHVQGNR